MQKVFLSEASCLVERSTAGFFADNHPPLLGIIHDPGAAKTTSVPVDRAVFRICVCDLKVELFLLWVLTAVRQVRAYENRAYRSRFLLRYQRHTSACPSGARRLPPEMKVGAVPVLAIVQYLDWHASTSGTHARKVLKVCVDHRGYFTCLRVFEFHPIS